MSYPGIGISIIIILLVPILFQMIVHSSEEKKRHREIMETLKRIESSLTARGSS